MADFDIGSRIFDYSKAQLEQKAGQFIRQRPFLGAMPPVCPDQILHRMPNVIAIEPTDALATTCKVEAMVLAKTFMHRDLRILVDTQIMNARDPGPYNMALAEEIGHIELHAAAILEIESEDDFRQLQRNPRWRIAEHDAKFFARALLMPQMMLERASAELYKQLVNENGFLDRQIVLGAFEGHLASLFEIPIIDAQKRLDSYPCGLRARFDESFATKSLELFSLVADQQEQLHLARRMQMDG